MITNEKVWIVYLLNGNEIRVVAQWVDDLEDRICFIYGWPRDVSATVAQFFTKNISGYLQVGGSMTYGEPIESGKS